MTEAPALGADLGVGVGRKEKLLPRPCNYICSRAAIRGWEDKVCVCGAGRGRQEICAMCTNKISCPGFQ